MTNQRFHFLNKPDLYWPIYIYIYKENRKTKYSKCDEFIMMESQQNVSILINLHQDFKIVKNVTWTTMDIFIKITRDEKVYIKKNF